MLIGYNNDIEYRDKVFHIQTEDRGLSDCKIETQIFHSGAILDTRITSYEKYRDLDEEERNRKVEALMKASHRDLYRKLHAGEYDAFAGLEPLDDGERSEVIEEVAFEPGQDRVPAGALEIEKKGAAAFAMGQEPGEHMDLSKLKARLSSTSSAEDTSQQADDLQLAQQISNLSSAVESSSASAPPVRRTQPSGVLNRLRSTQSGAHPALANDDFLDGDKRCWRGCEAPAEDLSLTALVEKALGL